MITDLKTDVELEVTLMKMTASMAEVEGEQIMVIIEVEMDQ
jgi:hypothetical protein